jgi:3-oxoacyl-[acyl-carrier protein] reductase
MPIYLSLEGKTALISGGSRGIGAATVRMFSAAGAQVVFSYQRAKNAAEKLVRECGPGCAAVQCDLDSPEAARGLVEAAVQRLGRLEVVVANHGIWAAEEAPIETMSAEQWRRTMAVNLDSVFGLVKHAVAQMKRQGRSGAAAGRIVLVSSSSGQIGEALHIDYAATKGALISMGKGLSTELAPDSIYVNCVAPGWVETELVAPALKHPEKRRRVEMEIPLGRLGKPEEIAAGILFLSTEHAGFVTGEVLNINGGEALVG